MDIEIIKVETTKEVDMGVHGVKGCWGYFRSSVVSGWAILVPYGRRMYSLVPGKTLSVETAQEGVSDFHILDAPASPSMMQLEPRGDYRLVGAVAHSSDNALFNIDVGDFSFALDLDETGGVVPAVRDSVSFTLHELSLWDEGY